MLILCDALDTLLYTLRRPYFRKMENQDALVCISEGIPEPTVEWVFCDAQSDRYGPRSFSSTVDAGPHVPFITTLTGTWGFLKNESHGLCRKRGGMFSEEALGTPHPSRH